MLFNFHIRLQMNILLIEYLLPITVPMPAAAPVLMHVRQWLSIRFYELRMNIKSAKRKDAPYNPQKAIDVLENWEKEKQKKQRSWRKKKTIQPTNKNPYWKKNPTNVLNTFEQIVKCEIYLICSYQIYVLVQCYVCFISLPDQCRNEDEQKKNTPAKKAWNRWKVENNALLAGMKLVKWNVTCTVSIESY